MTTWAERRTSDLIDGLRAGVSVRSISGKAGGPAVLKTSAIKAGRFDPRESKPVLPADLPRAKCPVAADSIIISRMNTPALVGDVGYVEKDFDSLFLPDRLWIARSKHGSGTDIRWLTYHFSSQAGARALRELATGTSGSMKNIPKDKVLGLKVLTPTPPEQRAIADALTDAENLISSLKRLISKKQAIKQGVIQKIVSDLQGETRTLGNIGVTIRGVSYNPSTDLRSSPGIDSVDLFRANNVQGSRLDFSDMQYISARRPRMDQFLQEDDILICSANGSKRLVGKAALVGQLPRESTFGAFMMVYRPDPDLIDPIFAALQFQTRPFRDWIDVLLSGSSINNLRPRDVTSFEIVLPSSDEQREIAQIIRDIDAEIYALERRLESARNIKQGMMQELLTGRTRLPIEEVSS